MSLQLHHRDRDPFYNPFNRWHREVDDLISPAMYLLRHMSTPRTILPTEDPSHFRMEVDVHQFAPEEITVKVVHNCVVIKGNHEERRDAHGYVSRQFVRRFDIPDGVKPEEIKVDLSSDGVLVLNAPRHVKSLTTTERPLPINYTGQPSLTHKPEVEAQKHAEATKKASGHIAA